MAAFSSTYSLVCSLFHEYLVLLHEIFDGVMMHIIQLVFIDEDFLDSLILEMLMLYNDKSKSFTTAVVGGREVKLFPFHFPLESFAFQHITPVSTLISFLDKEPIVLRKWTVKAALLVRESKLRQEVKTSNKSTSNAVRAYFSFCQLANLNSATDFHNYILLSILTTFNPLFRYEFLVWNKKTNCVEHYLKFQFIKDFRCDFSTDITKSITFYKRMRDDYLNSKRMVLSEDKQHNSSYVPILGLPFTNVINSSTVIDDSSSKKRVKLS